MKPKNVLITGGTGFIGSALAERLLGSRISVSILSRDKEKVKHLFSDQVTALESLEELKDGGHPDVIVNLAGKNLGENRWNGKVKQQLIDSRLHVTQNIIDYIANTDVKPALLINGSAVGYYGSRGDEELTENSKPGNEYQSGLCRRWEETAFQAQKYGVRVCISRTGVVLGKNGGTLAGIVPMFRLGLGAVVGDGKQWISWIHIHDLINMFHRFMEDDSLSGPFNNTSPYPVANREFVKTIGKVLHRPVFMRSPGWIMRIIYGEIAHLYLTGQKVIPARHLLADFKYCYPRIEQALEEVLHTPGKMVLTTPKVRG